MYYVYILQSLKDKTFYIGSTSDLKRRIDEHNNSKSKYSSSKIPFILQWHAGFKNKTLALRFERYLKSSSGFAFRNKHLI